MRFHQDCELCKAAPRKGTWWNAHAVINKRICRKRHRRLKTFIQCSKALAKQPSASRGTLEAEASTAFCNLQPYTPASKVCTMGAKKKCQGTKKNAWQALPLHSHWRSSAVYGAIAYAAIVLEGAWFLQHFLLYTGSRQVLSAGIRLAVALSHFCMLARALQIFHRR